MSDLIGLAQMCAPALAQPVSMAVMKQESGFNPFALGINQKGTRLQRAPDSYAVAVATAKKLIQKGYSIDMGLAQINSANLKRLGMSVEEIYQPCNNLKAMQTILVNCYNGANSRLSTGERLSSALSCYNTGNYTKGFSNGYVRKVTAHLTSFYRHKNLAVSSTALPASSNALAALANSVQDHEPNPESVAQVQRISPPLPDQAIVVAKNTEGLNDIFSSSTHDVFNGFN